MEIPGEAITMLAEESGFSKTDLRVWMYLANHIGSPTELVRKLGISQSQAYKSCNKLIHAGWIEIRAETGKRKWYRAKMSRVEDIRRLRVT